MNSFFTDPVEESACGCCEMQFDLLIKTNRGFVCHKCLLTTLQAFDDEEEMGEEEVSYVWSVSAIRKTIDGKVIGNGIRTVIAPTEGEALREAQASFKKEDTLSATWEIAKIERDSHE